jgi:hypothetical protein
MLDRICYSHEYIGPDRKSYDPEWIQTKNINKMIYLEHTHEMLELQR